MLADGWQERLIPLKNENTGGAAGLCLNVHDLLLAKYAANREKDRAFNRAVIAYGLADQPTLLALVDKMPLSAESKIRIRTLIDLDFTQNAQKT